MCLVVENRIPKLTLKPITVYKIFLATKNSLENSSLQDCVLTTPFRREMVKRRYMYTKPFSKFFACSESYCHPVVEEGYIHSCKSMDDAINLIREMFANDNTENITRNIPIICECEIPAFTWYFEGTFETKGITPSYCSKRLKIVNRLCHGTLSTRKCDDGTILYGIGFEEL